MSTTNDPIADFLTRIRNALKAQHRYVDVMGSRLVVSMLRVLKEQGFVENYLVKEEGKRRDVRVFLKYTGGRKPVIHGLTRSSKLSLRNYVKQSEIPRVYGGLGIAILTTSKGILSGDEARKQKVGGEVLCHVW